MIFLENESNKQCFLSHSRFFFLPISAIYNYLSLRFKKYVTMQVLTQGYFGRIIHPVLRKLFKGFY